MKKMNSVTETHKLCQQHQIGVSKRLIYSLAKSGEIPCVKNGRSILINWDCLMAYLDSAKYPQEEKNTSGIRKISA